MLLSDVEGELLPIDDAESDTREADGVGVDDGGTVIDHTGGVATLNAVSVVFSSSAPQRSKSWTLSPTSREAYPSDSPYTVTLAAAQGAENTTSTHGVVSPGLDCQLLFVPRLAVLSPVTVTPSLIRAAGVHGWYTDDAIAMPDAAQFTPLLSHTCTSARLIVSGAPGCVTRAAYTPDADAAAAAETSVAADHTGGAAPENDEMVDEYTAQPVASRSCTKSPTPRCVHGDDDWPKTVTLTAQGDEKLTCTHGDASPEADCPPAPAPSIVTPLLMLLGCVVDE